MAQLALLAVVVVTAGLVLLPASAEAQQQLPAGGGAGLSVQDTRAVYYFKRILAYSLLSQSTSPGRKLADVWSDCSKGVITFIF